ncbi:MAG TPA: hypothetical protein EYN66_22765 [Myxococcales bacterium]|nr:hypothetical protein [Myxococcales bacterium]
MAIGFLSRGGELWDHLGLPKGKADMLSVRGLVRAMRGEHVESHDDLTQAIRQYAVLGHQPGEAIAFKRFGRALLLAGDVDNAREQLVQARALFEAMEATLQVQHTQALLDALE